MFYLFISPPRQETVYNLIAIYKIKWHSKQVFNAVLVDDKSKVNFILLTLKMQ